MRTFTSDDAQRIVEQGAAYTKIRGIWAIQTMGPVNVLTQEGQLKMLPAGYFVATDGIHVWPIHPDFMAANYAEVDALVEHTR